MGNKNSGAKLTTTEYATRKLIDVVSAIAVPVASAAAGYVVLFHGEDIAKSIKSRLAKIRRTRQN